MDRLEKLMNLIENKYSKKTISEEAKSKIREIVRQGDKKGRESLEEVDDSQVSMTFASLKER